MKINKEIFKKDNKLWFTLVELIVVITILAILWTIAFISLNWYAKEARDTKRISDLRSLISKITLEHTRWLSMEDIIIETSTKTWQILWQSNQTIHTFWKLNFELLKENELNFKDPSNHNQDYYFAYARWWEWKDSYAYLQWATISEKNNITKIMWNYSPSVEWDVESLFLTWSTTFKDWWTLIYPIDNIGIINPTPTPTPDPESTTNPCVSNQTTQEWYLIETETLHNEKVTWKKEWDNTTIDNSTKLILKKEYKCNNWTYEEQADLQQELTCEEWYITNENHTECNTTPCKGTTPSTEEHTESNANKELSSWTWTYNETPWLCTYKCIEWYARIDNECKEIINWVCWSVNWENVETKPTYNLCTSWTNTEVEEWTNKYTWNCEWINWWTTSVECIANKKINWVCWNWWWISAISTIPNTDLCTTWTSTTPQNNTSTWWWSCNWSNWWVNITTCSRARAYCNTTIPSWTWVDTTTAWIPTATNQVWQNTDNTQACYFTCKANYSWTNCETYTEPLPDWVTYWNATTNLWCTWTDLIINKWTTNLTMAWCNSNVWASSYNECTWNTNCQWKYYTWANAPSACPSPRRLPTKTELQNMETNLWWWSTSPMNSPYYLTLAGANGSTNVGSVSYYWSSTEYNTSNAYILYVFSSNASVNDFSKTSAFSVRCVKN